MEYNTFFELTIIIVSTFLITGLVRLIKQPLIIGYLLTGIVLGPSVFNLISDISSIETLSKIGITILLFMVGIHLNPKIIKDVGKVAFITGIGQIVFTTLFGFILAIGFNYSIMQAILIAVAMTFSSTIIIMKLLSDKGDLDKLYGKISIGFLIVQDLVAALILMMLSSLINIEGNVGFVLAINLGKAVVLIILVFVFYYFVVNKVINLIAKSQEYLLLFALAWCLAVASLFSYLNFSMEIGALLAGMTLSLSTFRYEISSRIKPIRDFFIILFFIQLGAQMTFISINTLIFPTIVFSLFVLIGNPLIVMVLMGMLGYKKRVGFMSGLTVAQISEFSLILAALGFSLGLLNTADLSLITLVGIITISVSSYMIVYSDKIYHTLSPFLSIFEFRKTFVTTKQFDDQKYDVILFGYNRIGYDLVNILIETKKSVLVVDYNPDTISRLKKKGVSCIYGDGEDIELLNSLDLKQVKMIISTIPVFETNSLLIQHTDNNSKNAITIVTAFSSEDAIKLYKLGATYVIMPHFLGGVHTALLLEVHEFDINKYNVYKIKHLKYLEERNQEISERVIDERGDFYSRVY